MGVLCVPAHPRIKVGHRWAYRSKTGVAIDRALSILTAPNYRYNPTRPSARDRSKRGLLLPRGHLRRRAVDAAPLGIARRGVAVGGQDLVYSNGVIHHIPDTQRSIDEFYRVLRPGGKAIVMVYHRDSFNYRVNIMLVRRALALVVLIPGMPALVARITGEEPDVIDGHRALFHKHGMSYLTDRALFLSNNTDGPGNPLSKVLTRADALRMFQAFQDVRIDTRLLGLRLYPGGSTLAETRAARRFERRYGWHLWITAAKPALGRR